MTEYRFNMGLNAVLQLTTHYSWRDWKKKNPFIIYPKDIRKIFTLFGIPYLLYEKDGVDYIALVSRRSFSFKQIVKDFPHILEPFLTLKNLSLARREYLPNSISVWLWFILFFLNIGTATLDYLMCTDMYCVLKFQVWNLIITMTVTILVPFLLYYWRARKIKSNVFRILLKTEVVTLVFIALLVSGYIISSEARTGHYYSQLYKAKEIILRQ